MKLRRLRHLAFALMFALPVAPVSASDALVLMTDFGTSDGAVSAMRGVAYGVDSRLTVSDLTHQIPDYDIWLGAYRLYQTANYWPVGTVFVTVVDPGVGTDRKSVVMKTKQGRYFVGPNNGLYTLIAERDGVAELRLIDEKVNRLPGSADSYTFHGRDVYTYVGARLASGQISYEQVGPSLPADTVIRLAYEKPARAGNTVRGIIPVLDEKYGNVWTNIPKALFEELGIAIGGKVAVRISHNGKLVGRFIAPYRNTFGEVPRGQPLVYLNSLLEVALALNEGNFAAKHKISSGLDWKIELAPAGQSR
jgi:S-adenosylmethionine hydrolase